MSADIQPGTAGHTPGPWAYSEQTGEIYHDDGDVRPLIATVSLDNTTDEQADADARLIAAAPELLEALEYALESLGNPVPISKRHVARKIQEAIARARGEPA